MTLQNHAYVVVRGKDSMIDIPLLQDGELVPSDGITRCDLAFHREGVADITISSATNAAWFNLQEAAVIDGLALRMVRANLKDLPTPPADGRYRVDVFLWDSEATNGRLWGTVDVDVRPAPPTP